MRYFLISLVVLVAIAASVALVVRSFQQNNAVETARVEPAPAPKAAAPAERIEPSPPAAAEQEPPAEPAPAAPGSDLFTQQSLTERPSIVPGAPLEDRITPPGRLRLTAEQAERVRYVLLSHNVMQAEVSGIPLKVGGTIPQSVELSPLPIELSDAIPAYANYSYVILQNQIAIVTNGRREIEALIPVA